MGANATQETRHHEDTTSPSAGGRPVLQGYPDGVRLLVASDPRFALHDAGPGHPERPQRLEAVRLGLEWSGARDAVVHVDPVAAPPEAIVAVHPGRYLTALEEFAAAGGGHLDVDTVMTPDSFPAAMLAAGAGLEVTRRLAEGEGEAGLCLVRPPGHHATPTRAMGFCLVNNVAVTARHLADAGERVLIVDYDAHHGNGTQDAFWGDPSVVYVSTHEYPLYPGTGALDDMGAADGEGATVNFPLPAGATGDVALAAFDEVVDAIVASFAPTWLLVSAGFDAHRRDPLTDLRFSAGDFGALTRRMAAWVPPGRTVLFLEGGYDLAALAHSTAAVAAALTGTVPDVAGRDDLAADLAPTSGGPGRAVVDGVARRRRELGYDAG